MPATENGNKLYQPAGRKLRGGIPMSTIQEIMLWLSGTAFFHTTTEDRQWLFDATGGPPGSSFLD